MSSSSVVEHKIGVNSRENDSHQTFAPTVLVLFGGTGDLSNRKLLPAVYNLCFEALESNQPLPYVVVSVGRRPWDHTTYREQVRPWIEQFARKKVTPTYLDRFVEILEYYSMDLEDQEAYVGLLDRLQTQYPDSERLYYYAVSPQFFAPISRGLSQRPEQASRGRVIIEKPFGETLEQARVLQEQVAALFGEERVFHIDHYLGKEMVQNILTLRFENSIFSRIWDNQSIESVEITAAETVGVETRGGYYDQAGALRDMVQNHLFQILTILAMQRPTAFTPEALCAAQVEVLQALKPVGEEWQNHLVAAQYRGYREEPKVARDSHTETYTALVLEIQNEQWQGVPFLIRTGKCLGRRGTFVVIHFRPAPGAKQANQLRIEIQPDEGVDLQFNIKKPGLGFSVQQVEMQFCQSCQVEAHENTPEAYERLLDEASQGRKEFFSQWAQIEYSWSFVEHLRKRWQEAGCPLVEYEPGSAGPVEAEALAKHWGCAWSELDHGFQEETAHATIL